MKISLIITTYNWKEALELSILSALQQTRMPNEIIIADDGSKKDTSKRVQRMANSSGATPIIHVWQEDKGFRAARIRNRAIAKARSEYLVVIDGDIIVHPDFIRDHERAARPGFFCQGSRVLLTRNKTERVLKEKQLHFPPFEAGLENRKNSIRSHFLCRLFSTQQKSLKGIRTCNFALWRENALAVNGFNEDFEGWGREDSELAVRLMNRGIRRQNIKFSALAYHLFHPEHSKESLGQNDSILENTIKEKSSWCENGINKYLESSGATQ
jgi:glycosyltransferase involved in cell wall biosynthesis